MQRAQIRETLDKYFDDGELRTLCFDLGIDYDNLSGDDKADKARELVRHCERRGRVVALYEAIYHRRPNAFWEREVTRVQKEACGKTIEIAAPMQGSGGSTGPLLQFSLTQFANQLRETNERVEANERKMTILWVALIVANLISLITATVMLLGGR